MVRTPKFPMAGDPVLIPDQGTLDSPGQVTQPMYIYKSNLKVIIVMKGTIRSGLRRKTL